MISVYYTFHHQQILFIALNIAEEFLKCAFHDRHVTEIFLKGKCIKLSAMIRYNCLSLKNYDKCTHENEHK